MSSRSKPNLSSLATQISPFSNICELNHVFKPFLPRHPLGFAPALDALVPTLAESLAKANVGPVLDEDEGEKPVSN